MAIALHGLGTNTRRGTRFVVSGLVDLVLIRGTTATGSKHHLVVKSSAVIAPSEATAAYLKSALGFFNALQGVAFGTQIASIAALPLSPRWARVDRALAGVLKAGISHAVLVAKGGFLCTATPVIAAPYAVSRTRRTRPLVYAIIGIGVGVLEPVFVMALMEKASDPVLQGREVFTREDTGR